MSPSRFVPAVFVLLAMVLLAPFSQAQITNATNDTVTPMEGAGHDYIHLLSETVNPATGSVSLRIQVPVPKARGFTVPFSFSYDSNSVHHLVASYYPQYGVDNWASNTGYLSQGGWSYAIPQLDYGAFTQNTYIIAGYNPGQGPYYNIYPCFYTSNYVFQDSSGSSHSLYLGSVTGQTPQYCTLGGPTVTGGDVEVTAKLTGPAGAGPGPAALPVTVSDNDGTVYTFSSSSGILGDPAITSSLLSSIEDRNGNVATVASSGNWPAVSVVLTDTTNRPAISIAGFGPSGRTNTVTTPEGTYQVTWKTTAASFSVPTTWVGPSGSPNNYDQCTSITAASDSPTVISQITLPNGQAYHFYYGTDNPNHSFQNPYGLLSEIDYPSGGWVRYTWKLSDTMNELADYPGVVYQAGDYCGQTSQGCPVAVPDGCVYQYKTPVVASRQVGFGGSSNAALIQTFSYSTTWAAPIYQNVGGISWTQKATNVTTTDNVTNQNFLTAYTYSPMGVPAQPFSNSSLLPQLAIEQTTSYYGSATPTNPLRTVAKSWLDQFRLQNQQTTLDNGQTSQIKYTWTGDNITEKDEYDFGQSSPSRKTITSYQSFSGAPGTLLDLPCQTIVYDGSSNPFAETDYSYDGGTATCGSAGTPSVTGVSNLPSGTHDETTFAPGSTTPRGNTTSITKKCLQSCPNAVTTYTYDETGQVLSSKDPKGITTGFSYADSYTVLSGEQNVSYSPSHNTNTFLTNVTNPLGQTENFTYDYNNGQLTASKDENAQSTTYLYNDPFARPRQIKYPDGGLTTVVYNDSPYNPSTPSPNVTTTKAMTSSTNMVTLAAADGLGHVVETLLTSDPDCASGDRTDTTYDGQGHTHTVSNPYCTTSDPTYGITTYAYDALGRTTQVTHPDNSTILTTYTGRATQVQDEGNGNGTQRVTRISQSDALGRLNSICEVSSSSLIGQSGTPVACGQDIAGTGFLTTYQYDVLDNLLQVNQSGIASRTFVYDSLSRLTSAVNPESNTQPVSPYTVVPTTYAYDANGNLSTKTGPLQNQTGTSTVTTTYTYDALNRLTSRSYSDGTTPKSTYFYDFSTYFPNNTNTIGRLVYNTTTSSAGGCIQTISEYDVMGRVSQQWQKTPQGGCANSYPLPYTYDLMGNVTSFSDGYFHGWYPAYNAAGRLFSLTAGTYEQTAPYNLLSGAHYNAAGQITSDSLGTGETEAFAYTKRLQLQSDTATVSPTTIYSFGLTFAPNGNVTAANDNVNSNWIYQYDQFNRLVCSNLATNGTCASPTNGTPTYNYVYDRFGNRWQQNGPYTFTASFTGNNTTNNNRMDGHSYDTAGNLLYDGTHYYFYDAENHLIQVDGTLGFCSTGTGAAATACYVYDAEGRRVHRTGVVTDTCDGTGKRDYVYDLAGHWLLEVNANGTACQSEIYAGGRHLVTYAGGTPLFIHSDWLGTVRRRNSATYPTYNFESCTSLPFGDGLSCSGGDQSTLHFTGKERDHESGLDNFGARYNASNFGRFMSPDWSASPSPVPYASLPYPQSLNLYSYVQNNPLKSTDPTGHCTVDGETHGTVWCWAHRHGLFGLETKKETAAREQNEAEVREFLRRHPEYLRNAIFMAASLATAIAIEAGGMGSGEDGDSTVTPEENTAIEAGSAGGVGTARAIVNGVPQPAAEGEIVVAPNGAAVRIPAGYVAEPAANGNGIVYRPAGSTGNANIIRVSGPDSRNPTGYIRIYNSEGQPILPSTGMPGSNAQTHIPQ